MFTKKSAKIRKEFVCICCDYNTSDKKDYTKHINTAKHKNNTNVDIVLTNIEEKSANTNTNININIKTNEIVIVCNCGKKYKSRQGLYAHKKKCGSLENEKTGNATNNQLTLTNELIIGLINDNKEMRNIIMKQQEQISELIPKIGNNNIIGNANITGNCVISNSLNVLNASINSSLFVSNNLSRILM